MGVAKSKRTDLTYSSQIRPKFDLSTFVLILTSNSVQTQYQGIQKEIIMKKISSGRVCSEITPVVQLTPYTE